MRKTRSVHRGWYLATEIGAVIVLAAFFMAAGWVIFGDRQSAVTQPADQARTVAKPAAPPFVAEAPKPVEAPTAPVAPPPPVAVVAKPAAPPQPPPAPQSPPPPPKVTAPPVTNLTFQRDIFPILKAKCYTCHGENKKKLKGGLDLSTVRLLEKGGDSGPAVNRQQPELSPLWETVASGQMPPGKGNKLSDSEKQKLHDWIVGGAK